MSGTVLRAADAEALAHAAAARFVELAAAANRSHGRFTVALAGGSTPKRLYEVLATPPFRERVAWRTVQVFWGDERAVPGDHPDSNAGMARRALLDHVPAGGVFPVPTTLPGRPDEVAAAYEGTLRTMFGLDAPWPTFDLVLLGVGADGHTASLFPGSPVLDERAAWVRAAVRATPRGDEPRYTLTLPALAAARHLAFLAEGPAKAAPVAAARRGEGPSGLVAAAHGAPEWWLDAAAAP